MAQQHQQ
jgi:hypothetical protein